MTEEEPRPAEETPAEDAPEDWRSDPTWRLVWYRADYYAEADAPERPTEEAELAQPPIWASLYDGSRVVATWSRPSAPAADQAAPSGDRATVVAE